MEPIVYNLRYRNRSGFVKIIPEAYAATKQEHFGDLPPPPPL
jgi:hypothetical protein